MVGATIEGSIDTIANQVRMSGTFVPMYGLNNMFGQIPVLGLFLGGGSNEGLIGVTYEVVGTPGQPVLRVNPISAMAPGVLRKILWGTDWPIHFLHGDQLQCVNAFRDCAKRGVITEEELDWLFRRNAERIFGKDT